LISKLTLTDFGKFKDRSFDLAPVTLVYGANEAGKTTFFDGLFQALCNPSETKKAGKGLKLRYGSNRRASLVFDPNALANASILASSNSTTLISDDEFMNLYAIRAGDFNLELSQGSDWMERLKSRLFHGGIDPKLLVEEFEKLSSDKKTFVHNKKFEELQKQASRSRQELEARRREREFLLSREMELAQLEKSWQEAGKLKETLAQELRGMDLELALEEKIAQRQKISNQLSRFEEWQSLEHSLADLVRFEDINREDWEKRTELAKQAEAKLQVERVRRDLQAKLVATAKSEIRALKETQVGAAKRSQVAADLVASIKKAMQAKAGAGRPLFVGFSAGVFCLALALTVTLMIPRNLGLALGGLFILVGIGLAAFGWKRHKVLASCGKASDLEKWKDQWKLASSANLSPVELSSAEAFLQAMETCTREGESLERREQEALERLHSLEADLDLVDEALARLSREAQLAHEAEKQWLDALGISNGPDLLIKLSQLADLKTQRSKRKTELESLAPDLDFAELGRDLNRKLALFDHEGIPNRGRDEASLQRYRLKRQELQTQCERASQDEQTFLVKREGLAGEIRGALGNLAGDIVKLEDAIAQLDLELAAKERDKQAAAMVLDIFKNMGDGSDQLLLGLAQEMEQMLGRILPGSRGLALQGLGGGQLHVQDAGGGHRPLENLSTGTRDAVVLAAKLALALKSRIGAGILVLDEPFLAMDEPRESQSLALLQDFHTTHGWQIILLSKQVHLKEKVQGLMRNAKILNLE
jgi:AAA domain